MAKRLTDKGVGRLKAGDERMEVPDAVVPGLRLVVQPSGRKSWAVRTRLHGKPIKHTIGPWPAYGVAEAREAAGEVVKAAQRGEDPRALKRAAEADTVKAVVADWLKRDQAGNRTRAEIERMFENEVLPRWGGRQITEIGRRDCLELVDRIADRGAEGRARRVHAQLHRLFKWAAARDVIEANPMADLPKPGKENPRERVLTDGELARVWHAADAAGYPFGPAIKLLLLTGARREEIAELRWSEVGEDAIVLPGERTKTGDPRTIPLAPEARAIVEGLPRVKAPKGAPDYVFTTTGKTPVSGWSKTKANLDTKAATLGADGAALPEPEPLPHWVIHDLRRTLATGLQRLGVRLEVIEAVLGHVSGSRAGIVGVYQRHAFEDEKRKALAAWAGHVTALVEGGAASNVVPLHA